MAAEQIDVDRVTGNQRRPFAVIERSAGRKDFDTPVVLAISRQIAAVVARSKNRGRGDALAALQQARLIAFGLNDPIIIGRFGDLEGFFEALPQRLSIDGVEAGRSHGAGAIETFRNDGTPFEFVRIELSQDSAHGGISWRASQRGVRERRIEQVEPRMSILRRRASGFSGSRSGWFPLWL